jgi:hypothetical protein
VDATQTHEWVEQYNWDDGLDPIRGLVEDPNTEFATALLIYWRLDGPWFISSADASTDAAGKLNHLVRDRLLAGFYPKGKLRFDPTAELSRTQVYKLEKDGLPSELLRPAWAE